MSGTNTVSFQAILHFSDKNFMCLTNQRFIFRLGFAAFSTQLKGAFLGARIVAAITVATLVVYFLLIPLYTAWNQSEAQSSGGAAPLHDQGMIGHPDGVQPAAAHTDCGTGRRHFQARRSERARVLAPNWTESSVELVLLILGLGPNEDCAMGRCARTDHHSHDPYRERRMSGPSLWTCAALLSLEMLALIHLDGQREILERPWQHLHQAESR